MPFPNSTPSILITGAGPTGLFLALLLSRSAPSIPITILERSPAILPTAKAMAHMPANFPAFRAAGIWDELVAAANGLVDGRVCFRKAQGKEILAESKPGAPGPLTVPQHQFCEIILKKLRELGEERITIQMGWAVISLASSPDSVTVIAQDALGTTEHLTTTYLIAADGASSTIRQKASLKIQGDTLPRLLVATDVRYPFEAYGWSGGNFLADAKYYGLIGPITVGKDGLWRVSYAVPEDYTEERVRAEMGEWLGHMFPGEMEEEGYEVERLAVYKARQMCVETMRKGHILVVGDAAHGVFV